MKTRKQRFLAHPSKDKGSSILEVPSQSDSLIVLGHGAGAGMAHQNMQNIVTALHDRQIATFRYQFPFMERGGGRDSKQVSLATVASAVSKAAALEPKLPLYAGGHSFGGRMTSLAAAESLLPEAQGLVFFAFPLHPSGRPSSDRATHLGDIEVPMLFLSGTRDKLFSIDLFGPIVKDLGHSSTVHYLDTVDHSYKFLKRTRNSSEDVFVEMARVTRQWIG
jgi:predicted alpha/beta-hydrolase family hydrolase